MNKYTIFLAVSWLLWIPQVFARSGEVDVTTVADQGNSVSDSPGGVNAETPLHRWLELDALSFTMRYRNSFDTDGIHIFDDIQQRSLISGKLKFDQKGKYFVGFRAESGRYFNFGFSNFSGLDYKQASYSSSANATPQHQYQVYSAYFADPQSASVLSHITARGWEFYVRDLYLSATPVKWLTLQFGAIPIERGASSEITTYDEDGYISGERVSVHAPEHLFIDKVTFTSAYLGDLFTPNFFDRYDRLTQSNYRQILAEKRFGSRTKTSLDDTWLAGTNTVREAIQAKVGEVRVLDSARLELYQRTNDVVLPGFLAKSGNGWAFTGTKQFMKQLTVDGGYTTIDQFAGVYTNSALVGAVGFSINGDFYQVGKRFFGRANVQVAPGVSLFGFFTHQIDSKETPLTFSFTRQNLNFGMQLDFKSMLQHAHLL